jgi:protein-S-isoprenylcysteine O-methyltransferase Ste14
MRTSTRLTDYSMLTLSIVLGIGSVALFVALGSLHLVATHWPDSRVLAWDALLSAAFFLQHSGMVRRPVRARLAAAMPLRYQGAVYSVASGIALALVVILWQPSQAVAWTLHGPARGIATSVGLLAAGTFVFSAYTLGRSFDPLGLGPIRAHLRGRPYQPSVFVLRGPYLWVRHPLYSCVVVMFWSNAEMTGDHLLLAALWTIWIWVAAVLEERDLVAEFGDAYRSYQRQVPMLIPWRGCVTLAPPERV